MEHSVIIPLRVLITGISGIVTELLGRKVFQDVRDILSGLYVYGWFNWFPSSIMCRENGVMGVLVGKEVS